MGGIDWLWAPCLAAETWHATPGGNHTPGGEGLPTTAIEGNGMEGVRMQCASRGPERQLRSANLSCVSLARGFATIKEITANACNTSAPR
jgi:hypothetical protein